MEIELYIKSGRHLSVQDVYTSDPYLKFNVGGKKYKTKIQHNTIEPNWNEKFKINVIPGDEIIFECWDHDTFSKDDKMGLSRWIVPEMITGEKRYFILENDMRGNILIAAKCISGGKQFVAKPVCDPNETTIVKMTIEAMFGGVFWSYEYKNCKDIMSIVLEIETSVGKYRSCVHNLFSRYTIESCVNVEKTVYFESKIGEVVKFSLFPGDKKHTITKDARFVAHYVVPDFLYKEKTELGIHFQPYCFMKTKMKCLKSIYQHVIPQMIPPSFELNQGYSFPCEFIVKKLKPKKDYDEGKPFVKILVNGNEYTTSIIRNSPPPYEFNHSFILMYTAGMPGEIEIHCARSYEGGDRKFVCSQPFVFPQEFMLEKKYKMKMKIDKFKLSIEMKRIRDVSNYFKMTFIHPQYLQQQQLTQSMNGLLPPQIPQPMGQPTEGTVPLQQSIEGMNPQPQQPVAQQLPQSTEGTIPPQQPVSQPTEGNIPEQFGLPTDGVIVQSNSSEVKQPKSDDSSSDDPNGVQFFNLK